MLLRAAPTLFLLCALAGTPTPGLAQTRAEVIRGHVVTEAGAPVPDATVFATMAPERQVFQASTDSSGRYRIDVANGTGDYLVYISAVGRKAYRKRITREAGDNLDDTFIVDAVLEPEVTELAAVRVRTTRPRPSRDSEPALETGSAERTADGVVGAVSPDLAGDLDALAATIPGVTLTAGGFTALGLDPGQSQTTLNGMAFGASALPRDVRTRTRVYTSIYDPARGGFSGAQRDVELAPGFDFSSRRTRFSVDMPALQARDPLSSPLAQPFARVDASFGFDGQLGERRWHHNLAAQYRRHSSDYVSLLTADPDALVLAGIAPDSAARLVAIVHALGIPVSAPAMPSRRATDEVLLMGRLDHGRFRPGTVEPARKTWNVIGYARLLHSSPLHTSLLGTPGLGGKQRGATAMAQGTHSLFFGPDREWLHTLRSGFTLNAERSSPYLRMPDGRVLVSSLLEDGTSTAATLSFGGNSGMETDTRRWTWETVSETQLFPPGQARHRIKVHAQSRFDGSEQTFGSDAHGSFTFNSLEDVALNRPAAFTRTLGSRSRSASSWSGALAIGDFYRRSRNFQAVYGARVEANRFMQRPAYNPLVEAEFGARNDFAPGRIHLSPRFGFTWIPPGRTPGGGGFMLTPLSTAYTVPRGVVRGGVGEFRNMLSPTLLAEPSAYTGLIGAPRRLHCVGDAVPAPDWSGYAAGLAAPDRCSDGASPTFTDDAPFVRLVDRRFDAARSWRGNLSWSSAVLKNRVDYSIEGVYSLNLAQPGVRDLNFSGQPLFTLPGEGGRPVFVGPGSIVPATGTVAAAEARSSPAFGRVLAQHSDLRSRSRQLTLVVAPDPRLAGGRYFGRAAYTYGTARALAAGFDGAAFGDPREREWARSDFDTRHQLHLQLGIARRWVRVTTFTRVSSGLPYTPIVRGDVNGDGVGGDRAFVFDPATAPTPALAEAMQSLLQTASGSARDCLARHSGTVAGRNSCEGPWFATMNAYIAPSPQLMRKMFRSTRPTVAINVANPLSGLDQLLHGRNVRGWGAPRVPDPVLYTVRGFDPQTRHFQYEVNQRFGSTNPARTLARAPFRVTIDVRVNVGRPVGEQQLDRWLRPGRAGDPRPRLTVDSLRARYARNLPDMYGGILRMADSLLLSSQQVTALREAQAPFVQRLDSLWLDLATYMAGLPDRYDSRAALERQETTIDAAYEMSRLEAQEKLPQILNPIQLRLLPWPTSMFLEEQLPFGPERRPRIYFYM